MSPFLPLRAHLEWLKKSAKERLESLRARDPTAQLADAQLQLAREYGFPSWRAMVAHVDEVRSMLIALLPPIPRADAPSATTAPDDPDLARLLEAVARGDGAGVAELLARRPALARAHGPDGQTPLHV